MSQTRKRDLRIDGPLAPAAEQRDNATNSATTASESSAGRGRDGSSLFGARPAPRTDPSVSVNYWAPALSLASNRCSGHGCRIANGR